MITYLDDELHINRETAITGIPPGVWAYCIGGYQVLDKWFKSHRGEELDIEKFAHIQKAAGIISETIQVQKSLG